MIEFLIGVLISSIVWLAIVDKNTVSVHDVVQHKCMKYDEITGLPKWLIMDVNETND